MKEIPAGWLNNVIQGDCLELFMGSGTTGKMSVRMDRNFIGFELEPKYVEIAKKRIQAEKNQLKIF